LFIGLAVIIVVLLMLAASPIKADDVYPVLKVGIIADVHMGEGGSDARLTQFVNFMNLWKPDFVIDLGDAARGTGDNQTINELDAFRAIYDGLKIPNYRMAGNHDLDTITVSEWLKHTNTMSDQYSFNMGGYHFIVINTVNSTANKDISQSVDGFLSADLATDNLPSIIFSHKPLITSSNSTTSKIMPGADVIRQTINNSGKVKFVFSGHLHQNDYVVSGNITYITLDSSDWKMHGSFSCLTLYSDGNYWLKGYGHQVDYGKRAESDNQAFPPLPPIKSPTTLVTKIKSLIIRLIVNIEKLERHIVEPKASRRATANVIVAASTTSDAGKSRADFICDGTDDHVEIQSAIDSLPPSVPSRKYVDKVF